MEDENNESVWVGYMGILLKISTDIWKCVDSDTYNSIFEDAYLSKDALKKALSNMKEYFKKVVNGS